MLYKLRSQTQIKKQSHSSINLWVSEGRNLLKKLCISMTEQKDISKNYDDPMGRLVMKNAMSWHGWGSPTGLGLFLVGLGIFLWFLHLAGTIN